MIRVWRDAVAGNLTTLQQGYDNGTGGINTLVGKPFTLTGVTGNVLEINNGIAAIYADTNGRFAATDGYFNDTLVAGTVLPKANGTADIGGPFDIFKDIYSATLQTTNVELAANVLPRSNDAIDLGSGGSKFRGLYLGDTTLAANVVPNVTNTVDLGTTTQRFKDAYLSGNLAVSGVVSTSAVTASGTIQAGSTLTNGSSVVLGNLTVNGNITYNGAITGSKAHAEAYWVNGTLSMYNATQGVWSVLNGVAFPGSFNPWIAGGLNKSFTIGTTANPFCFQYDGPVPKLFKVQVSVCWSMFQGNGDDVELGIGKDGIVKPTTRVQSHLDDSTVYPRNASTCGIFTLAKGQRLEVFARNMTSANGLLIQGANIAICEL